MSLYEYAIAVDVEEAKEYTTLMFRLSSCGSLFQSAADKAKERSIRAEIHAFAEKHPIYDEERSICLGRPWTGEGQTSFTELIEEELGLDYRSAIPLGEEQAGILWPTASEEQRLWLKANAMKWVILANDNEY